MVHTMSDRKDDPQIARRRDAILRKLLPMPPQSRDDLAAQVRRARETATRNPGKSAGKRGRAD